jgi:hydrogenase maturation factor
MSKSHHACADSPTCITCSDAAVPMRVESMEGDLGICVDATGGRSEVMLALVPGARPGTRVLVHAGVALSIDRAPGDDSPGEETV